MRCECLIFLYFFTRLCWSSSNLSPNEKKYWVQAQVAYFGQQGALVLLIWYKGSFTLGGGPSMQYTDHLSWKSTRETYILLLSNVTPVHLIEKRSPSLWVSVTILPILCKLAFCKGRRYILVSYRWPTSWKAFGKLYNFNSKKQSIFFILFLFFAVSMSHLGRSRYFSTF